MREFSEKRQQEISPSLAVLIYPDLDEILIEKNRAELHHEKKQNQLRPHHQNDTPKYADHRQCVLRVDIPDVFFFQM
jgi:hypothetical protein